MTELLDHWREDANSPLQPDPSLRTFIRAIWNDPRQWALRNHVRNEPATLAWLEQDGPLPDVADALSESEEAARLLASLPTVTTEEYKRIIRED